MAVMAVVRKMWTREAREASAKVRQANAGKRTSYSQIQAPTYTSPSAQLQTQEEPPAQLQTQSTDATHAYLPVPDGEKKVKPPTSYGDPRNTPPEYTENGGSVNHLEVAKVISKQYGGNRFNVMTGASNFTAGKTEEGRPYLSFKIPRAKGITHVKTVLRPDDTYDVHLIGVHGNSVKEKHVSYGMHADQLESNFSHHTGLSTRLL